MGVGSSPGAAAVVGLAAGIGAGVVRLALLARLPVMEGVDGYARLAHAGEWTIATWLPLYQATVNALALVTLDIVHHRLADAGWGVVACGLGAALATRLLGCAGGTVCGVLLATSPLPALTSLSLAQEPLLVSLLAGAALLWQRAPLLGTLVLMAATLTRYEAWLAVALLVPGLLRERRFARLACLLAGPVTWMALAWEHTPWGIGSPERILPSAWDQIVMLGGLLRYQAGLPACGLAMAGALVALWRGPTLLRLSAALSAVVIIVLVVAPPYAPVDNPRQTYLLLSLGGLLAARAVASLGRFGWLSLVVLAPPLRVVAAAEARQGANVAAGVIALSEQLGPELGPGCRALVLSEGFKAWPDAETPACLHVAVYTQHPGAVVCDSEAHGWTLSELARGSIGWVVEVGPFNRWRPVHETVAAGERSGQLVERAVAGETRLLALPDICR